MAVSTYLKNSFNYTVVAVKLKGIKKNAKVENCTVFIFTTGELIKIRKDGRNFSGRKQPLLSPNQLSLPLRAGNN